MSLSRRHLLRNSSAVALGFAGLRTFITGSVASGAEEPSEERETNPIYGALKKKGKVFDLPEGFSCKVISVAGDRMDDGFYVPGKFDGMCAFPGPRGKTILVRNHELSLEDEDEGPFGDRNKLFDRIDRSMMYELGSGRLPGLGGTTTIVYDTKTQEVEAQFLSLAGTIRNCAGGPTPWNSWITCEETVITPDEIVEQYHGYNFEVPATAERKLADPVPLRTMGRFNHEAVAVDPKTGIVYETEDRDDGLFYRFIPARPGALLAGGRLQALRIRGIPSADTRNWDERLVVKPGASFEVDWVDMENVESPYDDLRYWAYFMKGAARFARGEGIWHGSDGFYFACTTGGSKKKGQIWRYVPSSDEGTAEEANNPGRLELFVEPNDGTVCENADNLTVAPWGDLIVCEDHAGRRTSPSQYLVGVTPAGEIYKLGRNAFNSAELAGVCFSPDGGTLFVNIYSPGLTLAITGPWRRDMPHLKRREKR
jgi:hypothetical protein